MEFVELTKKEYHDFWENHPLKTFLSALEIGKLREKANWKTYYVGVKDKKKIIAGTMMFGRKSNFGRYEFYSPRGYLLDFNDEDLVEFFTKNLKKYLQKKKAYIFRVDPYLIYKQRDIDGNVVEGGVDNSKVVSHLETLGFKKVPIKDMEQVGWMFSLDLEGKDEEQILKEMKPNTRNTIRKTEKFGITIKGEVKYYVTELDLKKYQANLKKEKKEKEEKLQSLSDAKYNEGQKKNLNQEIASLEKRIMEANEIRKKASKDVITLSGSMFMLIKPEVIYLSSGNYEEYMNYNSQYLIQWELIKYGIKNGFKKHNFYGIPANINEHPKDYGIYEFKRGFNGYVEELIGEFELPISWHYNLFKIIHKIKR